MKKYLLLLGFYFIVFAVSGQNKPPKTAQEYYDLGVQYIRSAESEVGSDNVHMYYAALNAFNSLLRYYPNDSLYPKTYNHVAELYYMTHNLDSALIMSEFIINTKSSPLGYNGDSQGSFRLLPYLEYKNESADRMHRIWFAKKNYAKALQYLYMADTLYFYTSMCGNGYRYNYEYQIEHFAMCFEKLNRDSEAVSEWLRLAFTEFVGMGFDPNYKSLYKLLRKNKSHMEIKQELYLSIENVYLKTDSDAFYSKGKVPKSWFIKFENAEIAIPQYIAKESDSLEWVKKNIKRTNFYTYLSKRH